MANVFYIWSHSQNKTMKYQNKILIFNSCEEAQMFTSDFTQYAITRAMMEGMNVVPIIQTSFATVSATISEDGLIYGEETINFETLKENIRNNNGNVN
jgi:hypothetical protein